MSIRNAAPAGTPRQPSSAGAFRASMPPVHRRGLSHEVRPSRCSSGYRGTRSPGRHPAPPHGCRAGARAPAAADAAAQALLAETAEELLTEYPESASTLGLDKDRRAGLKSRLTDRSPEGVSRAAAIASARKKTLAALQRNALSPATRLDVAVADTAYQLAAEGYAFPFGDVAILDHEVSYRNGPYVVTQNMGAFVEVPEFLDSQHDLSSCRC